MRFGVLLLCACNQFYGLEDTRLPPPDAPFACPELGMGAPSFSPNVQQALQQSIASYHFDRSGELAVGSEDGVILFGRLDGPLTPRADVVEPSGAPLADPHPSPDGNRLYIHAIPDAFVTSAIPQATIMMWERSGDTWRHVGNLDTLVSNRGGASTVFNGVAGDRIIFAGTTQLFEYERSGMQWVQQGIAHSAADLDIERPITIGVTSDGLRAVYRGATSMMYTDRKTLDTWFRTPVPLAGVPKVYDAQFTDDCSRIYYAGLGVAFFSRQQ